MSEQRTSEQVFREYEALCNDLNKLVKALKNARDQEPGSLRVGLNTAMADHSALAKLLIDKGLITELEYGQALLEMMKLEVRRAAKDLGAR